MDALQPMLTQYGPNPARSGYLPDQVNAYRRGLMRFRRARPPSITVAAYGEDGALRGALETGLDLILSETGLDAWSE